MGGFMEGETRILPNQPPYPTGRWWVQWFERVSVV